MKTFKLWLGMTAGSCFSLVVLFDNTLSSGLVPGFWMGVGFLGQYIQSRWL